MNEQLKLLESLGFVLPSPAYIAGAIVFGIVGLVAFRWGKKISRPKLTWTGVVLMLYPYVVYDARLLWLVGFVLCGLAYWLAQHGDA